MVNGREASFLETYRIDQTKGMELGLYTLGDLFSAQSTDKQMSEHQRMKGMISKEKLAEEAGLDVFGVGESHQKFFIASSTPTILGTIAGVTKNIKLISVFTVS